MSAIRKVYLAKIRHDSWTTDECDSLEKAWEEVQGQEEAMEFNEIDFYEVVKLNVRLETKILEVPSVKIIKGPK